NRSAADAYAADADDGVAEDAELGERENPLAADLGGESEGERHPGQARAFMVIVGGLDDQAAQRHRIEGQSGIKRERDEQKMPEEIRCLYTAREPPQSDEEKRQRKCPGEHEGDAPPPTRAEIVGQLAEIWIEHCIPKPLDEDDAADQGGVEPERHVVDGADEDVEGAVGAVG